MNSSLSPQQKAEEARRLAAEDAECAAAEAKMWEEARQAKVALKAAREEKKRKAALEEAKAQEEAEEAAAAAAPMAGPTLEEIMAMADEEEAAARAPAAASPEPELTLEQIMALEDEKEARQSEEQAGRLQRVHTVTSQQGVQDDFHSYLKETYGSTRKGGSTGDGSAASSSSQSSVDWPDRQKALEEYVTHTLYHTLPACALKHLGSCIIVLTCATTCPLSPLPACASKMSTRRKNLRAKF